MMDELEKLYFKLPKESFELLLRNVIIREELFNAWRYFLDSDFESLERSVDKVFDEMFRVFFKQLKLFGIHEKNTFDEFLRSYVDFTNSLLRFWFSFFEIKERNLVGEFLEYWMKIREKFTETLVIGLKHEGVLREFPFISKDAVIAVFRAIESYDKFNKSWNEYKNIISKAWVDANKKFVGYLKMVESPEKIDFKDFVDLWMRELSSVYDEVMRSEKFVRVQSEMLHNLMDFLRYKRTFNEMLFNYPSNPFALKSEIDEAYKRIQDLKREVNRLNKRVKELEHKLKEVTSE